MGLCLLQQDEVWAQVLEVAYNVEPTSKYPAPPSGVGSGQHTEDTILALIVLYYTILYNTMLY